MRCRCFRHGPARWLALKYQAMGDGILDAAVLWRGEMSKPEDAGRMALIARQRAAIDRDIGCAGSRSAASALDVGSITVACALGYLDFRFAAWPWRETHPKLAAWFEAFAQNPGIAQTVPKDPG